jgi:transmembrane sensor
MKDFLNDPKFQEYVFEGKHKKYWSQYLRKNPENLQNFKKAEDIAHSLEFKPYIVSPEKYQHYLNHYKEAVYIDSAYQRQLGKASSNFQWEYFAKVAAVIAIVIFSFWLLLQYDLHKASTLEPALVGENVIIRNIPKQMKSSLTLRDGTQIKINSESTLEFPEEFSSDSRKVILKGEAFFDVAPDPIRPFLIHSEDITIKVIGTSFNVRNYDDEAVSSVAVKSGEVIVIVSFEGKEETRALQMGEMVSVNKADKKTQVSKFDPDEVFGWTDGKIVFTNADMQEIVRRLERWYDVEIQVNLKKSIMRGYTGKFSNVSLEHILQGIGYSLGFDYEIKDKKVRIYD